MQHFFSHHRIQAAIQQRMLSAKSKYDLCTVYVWKHKAHVEELIFQSWFCKTHAGFGTFRVKQCLYNDVMLYSLIGAQLPVLCRLCSKNMNMDLIQVLERHVLCRTLWSTTFPFSVMLLEVGLTGVLSSKSSWGCWMAVPFSRSRKGLISTHSTFCPGLVI